MKNAKFAGVQRLLSAVFAATVALTSVQIPVYATPQTQAAEQTSQLVNIAGDCEITVPSSQSGYGAERMTDGDSSTMWIQNDGTWPSTVSLKLPADNTKRIKKVVLKFESGQSAWGVDVTLSHALNNVTSDLVIDNTATVTSFDDGYEFTYDTALSFTHTFIELSNPTNNGAAGGFWPALAEVEIWAENESGEESLTNVAPAATITSVGGDTAQKATSQMRTIVLSMYLMVVECPLCQTVHGSKWNWIGNILSNPWRLLLSICLLTKTISSLPSISMGRVQLTRNGRHSLPE